MNQSIGNLSANLALHFDKAMHNCEVINDQVVMTVPVEELINICTTLRDEEVFDFAQLMDLSGVDYSTYGEADWQTKNASSTGFSRAVVQGQPEQADVENGSDDSAKHDPLAVVYQLLSLKHNQRLRIRCFVSGEPPIIPSVINIWNSADWYEREAFDLFGILFEGHPDLRRILTDYGFIGHPFRKDFPLEGNVEVRYDEEKGRVVYQPVTIENRVLVPRVIRDDFDLGQSDKNPENNNNKEGGHA